jgi:hypothetical protein
MDPLDAAAAVGTIFDHLFPGFYIQHSRQFAAFLKVLAVNNMRSSFWNDPPCE